MRLALIVLLLLPGSAAAQDASREDIARAREIFDEGSRLFAEERFIEAAEAYERAYEVVPRPLILLNAATAYERALELEQAADLLERYLETAGEIDDRAELAARLERMRELSRDPASETIPEAPYVPPQIVVWPLPPPAARTPPAIEDDGISPWFPLGAATGIAAILSTAIAIGFGVAALDRASAFDAACNGAICENGAGALRADAFLFADVSNAMGSIGLVLGAGAIGLVIGGVLEPPPAEDP
jgi:tetratricopeptide (TPR) repeat protein